MSTKKLLDLPPRVDEVLKALVGRMEDDDPLLRTIRLAYNDGWNGVNEDHYPKNFEAVSGAFQDSDGYRDMTSHDIWAINILLKLERFAWEQGRADAGRVGTR